MDDQDGEESWIASFCGFAPADDPEVVCLIAIDHPTTSIYGSTVAAPTFREVMKDVLNYMGVEKTGDTTSEIKQVAVPYVKEMDVKEAEELVKKEGLKVKVLGNGTTVVAQYPDPKMILDEGSTVYLFTDEDSIDDLTEVPDFTGLTLKKANTLAAQYDLNINITGNTGKSKAVVVKQSIEVGSKATKGTIITLRFDIQSDTD